MKNEPKKVALRYLMELGVIVIPKSSKKERIKKACKDLKAAYPDVNWKEGKLLNRASKQELETWIKGL